MKYTNKEKSAVQHGNSTIPREHWMWIEEGIQAAEDAGLIELFQDPEEVYNRDTAKVIRDTFIDSDIEVHGAVWQVAKRDRDNMKNTLDAYARNLDEVAASEIKLQWIIADNTVRETTLVELEGVLDGYTIRMGETFARYSEWCDGEMKDNFYPLEADAITAKAIREAKEAKEAAELARIDALQKAEAAKIASDAAQKAVDDAEDESQEAEDAQAIADAEKAKADKAQADADKAAKDLADAEQALKDAEDAIA